MVPSIPLGSCAELQTSGMEDDRIPVAVGIVGPGLIGKTLIAQLAEQVCPLSTDPLFTLWGSAAHAHSMHVACTGL